MAAYSTSSTSSFSFNDSEKEEKENAQKAIENPLLLRSPPARPNTNNHYGSNASENGNGNHGGALTIHSQNNGEMGLRQRKMPHGDSFGPPPRASLSMGTVVNFLPPTKQDVSATVRVQSISCFIYSRLAPRYVRHSPIPGSFLHFGLLIVTISLAVSSLGEIQTD
jgi:hypothetical protein